MPVRVLKETAYEIAPSLCELLKKSLRLSFLPMDWKLANVVPVLKKDNKKYAENYRPISLLCLVSKVMERCVFNLTKDHGYGLIESSQHGFITVVRDAVGRGTRLHRPQLDNGGQVDVIYIDMSKAFDKVTHRKLHRKLRDYGFSGKLLVWLESYLHDRMQRLTALGVNLPTLANQNEQKNRQKGLTNQVIIYFLAKEGRQGTRLVSGFRKRCLASVSPWREEGTATRKLLVTLSLNLKKASGTLSPGSMHICN